MTVIKAEQVKTLRERTGAGMMECKKALQAVDGNIDKAIDLMRKSGQAKADKKAGRVAAEGAIVISATDNSQMAAIVEVNCETDFVARDDTFKQFCDQVGQCALTYKINDVKELMATTVESDISKTLETLRQELIAKLGENINVRRVALLETTDGLIGHYVHGGRIGVLVSLTGGTEELAKDIAMHIAASNPEVIEPSQYPEAKLAKEREIYIASAGESGKPSDIIEKIIQGKLDKFLDQVSLIGQPFVKDDKVKVGTLLKNVNAKVTTFIRYQVGEGIEKTTTDFAEEVMSQVRGN